MSLLSAGITAVAALVGAALGVLLKHWLEGRNRRAREREELVQRYLFQLQDAVDSLWYRLDNLKNQGGGSVMSDDYREVATLYAFGRVLAIERIMLMRGVYPQIRNRYRTLGEFLMKERLDLQLTGLDFHQYHRIALAETAVDREEQLLRTGTFLDFQQRCNQKEWPGQKSLQAARTLLVIPEERVNQLLGWFKEISYRLEEVTKLPSAIKGAGTSRQL